jgi:hypothetical protein
MKFILNASNSYNTFDDLGHFLLANVQITNCVDYSVTFITGCSSNWLGSRVTSAQGDEAARQTALERILRGDDPAQQDGGDDGSSDATATDDTTTSAEAGGTSTTADSGKGTKDLLNFLIGSGR